MTHIVLASDAGYLDYVACSIRQLAKHAPACEGIVLAVPPGMHPDDLTRVEKTGAKYGLPVEVVEMPKLSELEGSRAIASRDHVSTFTYSKLFMADAMPRHDQVLYLDVDTLVRDSIDELLAWRLREPIGAVHEMGSNGVHLFGSTRVSYFNAGVLRMSLARMREEDVSGAAIRILRESPRLPFQDQDVLNRIFRDRHDVLPLAYNVFDSVAEASLPAWKVLRDPAIVHFVGPTKPWHTTATSKHAREWRRMNSEVAGLEAPIAREYVDGDASGRREKVAFSIASARQSPIGMRVRNTLPLPVKHTLNMTLLKLIPPRSLLSREVLKGMNASVDPAPGADADDHGGASWRAAAEQSAAAAQPGVEQPSRSGGRAGLLLVMSLPRSGTTALNSMLTSGVLDVYAENEFYFGIMPEQTRVRLERRFPWIDEVGTGAREGMSPAQVRDATSRYRSLMSENVMDVTAELVRGRVGPSAVKVFPDHLEPDALAALLDGYRPRVIVLRRMLLFSYISYRKAMQTRVWFQGDNTEAPLHMSDDDVARYVSAADAWFARVGALCEQNALQPLGLTYESLLEHGDGVPALRELLSDCRFSPAVLQTGTWAAATRMQDRRTDSSLQRSMHEFARLSPQAQRSLLRYPGDLPD